MKGTPPNAQSDWGRHDGATIVRLKAIKNIRNGQEIIASYGRTDGIIVSISRPVIRLNMWRDKTGYIHHTKSSGCTDTIAPSPHPLRVNINAARWFSENKMVVFTRILARARLPPALALCQCSLYRFRVIYIHVKLMGQQTLSVKLFATEEWYNAELEKLVSIQPIKVQSTE